MGNQEVKNFTHNGRESIKTYAYDNSELIVDKMIADTLTAYRPQGLVSEVLFPVIPVTRLFGLLPLIPNGEFNRGTNAERAPGTPVALVAYAVSSVRYHAKNYALGMVIPVEDEKNADREWKTAETAGLLCADLLRVGKERRAADIVNSGSNVNTAFVANSSWASVGNPIGAIDAMISRVSGSTGFRPTRLIFGAGAWGSFKVNSAATRVFGESITTEKARDFFRLEQVVVADGYLNSAAQNLPILPQPIFDDCVIGVVQPPVAASDFWPRYGVTPSWTPPGIGPRYVPRKYYDENIKATVTDVMVYEGETVIDKNLCAIIKGVNSAQSGGI
jgi:hypothetical protein